MLVIRLARMGRNKYPVYRIVVADKRRAATSKSVAILGHYNPHTKDLVIKKEELQGYIEQGAQPSNRVLILMQQEKMDLPKWASIKTRNRKPKKEPEANEASAEIATESADSKPAPADDDATETAQSAEASQTAGVDTQEAVAEAAQDANDQAAEQAKAD